MNTDNNKIRSEKGARHFKSALHLDEQLEYPREARRGGFKTHPTGREQHLLSPGKGEAAGTAYIFTRDVYPRLLRPYQERLDVHIKIEGGMSAIFRLSGALKDYTNKVAEVEVSAGLSVRQALVDLMIPPEIVALVLVNDQPENKDYIIQENDRIQLLAVIGGG